MDPQNNQTTPDAKQEVSPEPTTKPAAASEPTTESEAQNTEPQSAGAEGGASTGEAKKSEQLSFSVIGYILPFLFFLPLIDEKTKHDPAVRFHANQQLILLIIVGGVYFLHSTILMALSSLGYLIMQVLSLAVVVLIIIGALNAHKGKMKELPYVGQFRILK